MSTEAAARVKCKVSAFNKNLKKNVEFNKKLDNNFIVFSIVNPLTKGPSCALCKLTFVEIN